MPFYPAERVGLFIDGSNLYASARALGFDIDYKRLHQYFSNQANLVRAYYYTALLDERDIRQFDRLWIGWITMATTLLPSQPKNSPMRRADARSKETWISNLLSMSLN